MAAPNLAWVGDFTYIATNEGWLFLAVVIDLFSRKVVGWSMRPDMQRNLVIDALEMAWFARNPGKKTGLLFHSDRGSQYASDDFSKVLKEHGITPSMSRKGDCWDNAPMESFFHTLKTERVHHRVYPTRDQARRDLFGYIEGFYNPRRLHSALGYISPADAERKAAQPRPLSGGRSPARHQVRRQGMLEQQAVDQSTDHGDGVLRRHG